MANILRWNPFREMAAMQNALDRMFDEGWQRWSGFDEGVGMSNLVLDIDQEDNNYVVTTALPGVKAEDINVRLHNDMLTIEGEIPEQSQENEGRKSLMKERYYGRFSRTIRLPQPVNRDLVEASFDNGVLTLTVPKSPEAQPKQIPVKTQKQLSSGNGNKK
jgi:HSP20 family protein